VQVVLETSLRIRQGFICSVYQLEQCRSVLLLILVRMVTLGHFTKGLAYSLLVSVPRHSQQLIAVGTTTVAIGKGNDSQTKNEHCPPNNHLIISKLPSTTAKPDNASILMNCLLLSLP
jgi:hypothetical protein